MVLDEEDGELKLLANFSDERSQLLRLLRVHAGGRFVEKQKLRVGRKRARNLKTALFAVGKGGGEFVF